MRIKEEKKTALFLTAALIISFILAGAFVFVYRMDNINAHTFVIPPNVVYSSEGYLYGIDPVSADGDVLTITGWAARRDRDLTYVNRKVLLVSEGECFELNTVACDRGLTAYFNTGFNYDLGGIQASCAIDSLPEGRRTYRVMFLVTEAEGDCFCLDLNTEVELKGRDDV